MDKFLLMIWVGLMGFALASDTPAPKPMCKLFAFGDSNTDVGGLCALYGKIPVPPPGHKPSCRASDGLMYVDYLCSGLGMRTFLSPYLEPLGSDFSQGANFAVAGAHVVDGFLPLPDQIRQFARFQYRVKELMKEGKGRPEISDHDFGNSIYTIDIGQNGLTSPIFDAYNLTKLVTQVIPNTLSGIENATRDKPGCIAEYNQVSTKFNDGLASMATRLRDEMKEATVVYIDMYSIKYDLFANSSKYGFDWTVEACLGYGRVCADPSKAVSWDGTHYTQAANKIVAARIMAGDDAFPFTPLKQLCQKLESF